VLEMNTLRLLYRRPELDYEEAPPW
jgi:hypothetical protein